MRGYLVLLLSLLAACSSTQPRQGIKGQVLWVSGNQLPGPDSKKLTNIGIQRELHIYELTTMEEATMSSDGFFFDIKTHLVTTTLTKTDGTYKLRLPPGEYSIFVKEDKGLFANRFGKNNTINPVIVSQKGFAWVPITVNYKATY